MRPDLQTIEKIEAYMNGIMDASQKEVFEKEISVSSDLKDALEYQKLIQQAVIRKGIQAQVAQFAPATISSISFWTRFKMPIILSSVLLIASLGIAFMSDSDDQKEHSESPSSIQKPVQTNSSATVVSVSGNNVPVSMLLPQIAIPSNFIPAQKVENKPISRDLDGLATWIEPSKQLFNLAPNMSHTLECENGTLIIVPKNAFCDKNGKTITENVQLEVVEALNMADMIAYNLTTMNDNKALQSGGMLYVQPKLNGEKVMIQKDKPLHIEVPTNKVVPGMMAWKGEVNKDGNINWTAPEEIKKFLIPVNFSTLDFLPDGFASAVAANLPYKKYKKSSKNLVDSLYYSLSTKPLNEVVSDKIIEVNKQTISDSKKQLQTISLAKLGKDIRLMEELTTDPLVKQGANTNQLKADPKPLLNVMSSKLDNATQTNSISYVATTTSCYINPLSIKSIIAKPYANTFIATKEFEERLKVLHKIPNAQAYFELYVNNLTKNLYEVDQMVANKLTGEHRVTFQAFADQKLTNVDNKDINQDELRAFYNSSRTNYQKEVNDLREAYQAMNQKEITSLQKQLNELANDYYGSRRSFSNNSQRTYSSATSRKFKPTIDLGNKKNTPLPVASVANMPSYSVSWYTPGWVNLDGYYPLLSAGEQIVSIDAKNNGLGTRIFQCINLVKSVIPLNVINEKYEAHFPKAGQKGSKEMENTYCVGIQKDNNQLMYAEKRYNPYSVNSLELFWSPVSDDELYRKLKELSPSNDNLIKSLDNEIKMAENAKKMQEEKVKREAIEKAKKEAFDLANAKINAEIKAKNLAIQKENEFIQSLINAIDPCNSTAEECLPETEEQTGSSAEIENSI